MNCDAPLYDSWFALNWANRHFRMFGEEATAFFEANPPELVTETDADTGWQVVKLKLRTRFPDEFSAIIGDCLHNLRSALDYAIVELAGDSKASFGFNVSKDAFTKTIQNGKYSALSQEAIDVICAAKPYKGGNDMLYGLDRARNVGTHRFLIPTAHNIRSIYLSNAVLIDATFINGERSRLDDGIPLVRIAPGGHFLTSQREGDFRLGVGVLFGEVEGIEYKEVESTVPEMHRIVSQIVSDLAATIK